MKRFLCLSWFITFCVATNAEDRYPALAEWICKRTENYTSKENLNMCLDEFKNCWLKAKDPYDKAMALYSSNIQKAVDLRKTIENNKQKIVANKKEIDKLGNLVRDEFEERDAFKKRVDSAAREKVVLANKNKTLEQENSQMEALIWGLPEPQKPSLSLKFSKRFESFGSCDCHYCEIGQYDIDSRTFPCRMNRDLFEDDMFTNLERYEDFVIESSMRCDQSNFRIGPFESTEEAKRFKEGFQAGKQKVKIVIDLEVEVTSGVKQLEVDKGGEKTSYTRVGKNTLKLAGWALVSLLKGTTDGVDVPDFEDTSYRVEPTYKSSDAYFINGKVRFKPRPN